MSSKSLPSPAQRYGSIRVQLALGVGVILLLTGLLAVVSYQSLDNVQDKVQIDLHEAHRARELSLEIENKFLLARQVETEMLNHQPSLSPAQMASYVSENKQRLGNARLDLNELRNLAQASNNETLHNLTDEIDQLPPLFSAYEDAFLATATALEQRTRPDGLEDVLENEMQQLEAAVRALRNPDLMLLILDVRAAAQNYLSTGRQEYVDNVRLRTNAFIRLVEDSPTEILAGNTDINPQQLIQHAQNYQSLFSQLAGLDHNIEANVILFQNITTDCRKVTDWVNARSRVTLVDVRDDLEEYILGSTVKLGIAVAFALGLGVLAAMVLTERITQPLRQLGEVAERIGRGELTQEVSASGSAELVMLGAAFNNMAGQLRHIMSNLEEQVAARTREAERRAAQIATGAEIARAATTQLDPDTLISEAVNLVQERFEFYYVGLFLLDAERRYAVLHYGAGRGTASQAGRVMKESGHRLEIGGQSMIGWACAHQQARIALDVGEDAVRFANPNTPDTRSEMALPMRVGEHAIGALSIQSAQEAAFDKSDIAALQGMADQIATALENARLFQQTQKALKELDDANRLLVQRGWESYLLRKQETRAAEFCPTEARPTSGSLPHILRIPLNMGQQSMGSLVMERDDSQRPWTDEENNAVQTIVQQTMLAIDTARLFEESQRLAARERLINEITARIRNSMTLEGVLNSTVREISQITGASYAAIELTPIEDQRNLNQ